MKTLFAIICMLAMSCSFGDVGPIDQYNNLTPLQRAEVAQRVAQLAYSNTQNSTIDPTNVDKWVQTGENVGKMFGGAAKEVGIAVNEFVKTPVGKWTMVLIIWTYMGNAIVHIIGGLLILIISVITIWTIDIRARAWNIVYDPERRNMFGQRIIVSKTRSSINGDRVTGYLFAYGIAVMVSLAVMFTYN